MRATTIRTNANATAPTPTRSNQRGRLLGVRALPGGHDVKDGAAKEFTVVAGLPVTTPVSPSFRPFASSGP